MEVQENRAVAYHEVCIEVQENLAVAMNVNIPPHPPPKPVNKHNDQNHAETEKNEDSTRPLNSVDTTNLANKMGHPHETTIKIPVSSVNMIVCEKILLHCYPPYTFKNYDSYKV